jgi:hypothetical protein
MDKVLKVVFLPVIMVINDILDLVLTERSDLAYPDHLIRQAF